MKQPQPNTYEQNWQDLCRVMYPTGWAMHHCRSRKAKFVRGIKKIPIGHLYINMLPPGGHSVDEGGIHADPNRRDLERENFKEMCEKYESEYGSLDITLIEFNACLDYR